MFIYFLGVQDEFSQTIIKLGKPTVVVLINGGAIAIEYLKTSPAAVLEAFYPGFSFLLFLFYWIFLLLLFFIFLFFLNQQL
jgi:hypothetical protein